MPSSANSLGRAIIDQSGSKPVRIGSKVDGFDMVETIQNIKEATLSGAQKSKEALDKNKAVVIPAISTLQSQVQNLHDNAVALSNYLGADPSINNTFQTVLPSVTTTGTINPATCVGITIDSQIAKSTNPPLAIRITQLATVDSRVTRTATVIDNSNATIANANAALGLAGSFSINGGVINVSATDTLNTVIANINNSNSNVQASYIQNGTNFSLILAGTVLATPLTFTDTNNFLANNFGINITSTAAEALQAKVQYDIKDFTAPGGVVTQTYLYNTNIVTNLSPGVTINLLNTTNNNVGGSDTLNIALSNNTADTYAQIVTFFNNYNSLREVVNRNLLTSPDGGPLDPKATMFNSPLIVALRQKLDDIANITLIGAGANDYKAWADIGISLNQNAAGFDADTYTLDGQALQYALTANFSGVKKLFGDYAVASNKDFRVFNLGDNLSTTTANGKNLSATIAGKPITVTYSLNNGVYYAAFSCAGINTGSPPLGAQSGATIINAPKDSVFEGIALAYSGPALADPSTVTFTMTVTQGVASTITQSLNQTLDPLIGQFIGELNNIKDKDKVHQEKIDRIQEKADRIEKKMLAQNARLDVERNKYSKFTQMLDNMFKGNK